MAERFVLPEPEVREQQSGPSPDPGPGLAPASATIPKYFLLILSIHSHWTSSVHYLYDLLHFRLQEALLYHRAGDGWLGEDHVRAATH